MVALIILGAIALVITLIMLVPVGADVGYESGELRLVGEGLRHAAAASAKAPGRREQAAEKEEAKKREKTKGKKTGGGGRPEKEAQL